MRRTWWLAAMAVAVFGGAAVAQDAFGAVYADEPACEDVKTKPVIELGGKFDVAMYASRYKVLPAANVSNHINSTEFRADAADLTLTVKPTESNYLTVTLDLDDAWNENLDQDDFLKEIYFTFESICNTGFGLKVGKMGIPFGYDKDDLLVSPYIDGYGESAFSGAFGGPGLPVFGDQRPTYIDNQFAITPSYNFCDKFLVEASLFQYDGSRDNNVRRRTNDNMLFKSMAVALTWTPIENLIFKVSGITTYSDENRGVNNEKRRSYGSSVAVDYTFQICNRDLNLFAEWMHGWNPAATGDGAFGNNFRRDAKSDDIHFGAAYNLTQKLKIHAQGEWLSQRQSVADTKRTLWRAVAAAQYELASGIVLEGGYQHEWLTTKAAGNKLKYNADTWFAGLRYKF